MDIPDDKLPVPELDSAGLFDGLSGASSLPIKSYRVLARKYRPQNFDDLIGQETMVRTLRNAFSMDRVAHAFMLTGVRGIGKTTTARIIARALNCIGADGTGTKAAEPCGVCANCKAILADRHPDVLEIDAASHTGVDDVREIIEGSRFRPIQARMKVYIIDEVHMLSRNAFNALLKTLEEPPEQVTFIFATTEIRKVPVTVLSRCQRFDLRRVSQEQLSQHFLRIAGQEKIRISEEAINLISRAADGSVRDGLSLLDQAIAQAITGAENMDNQNMAHQDMTDDLDGSETAQQKTADNSEIDAAMVSEMLGFADKALIFDLFEAVITGKADQVLKLTEQAYVGGVDLGVLLSDLLELVHLLSRMQALPNLADSPELSELERVRGKKMADRLSIPVLGRTWQMLLKGMKEVDGAPNRKAAAEMILIRLCYVADMPSPAELIKQMTGPGQAQGQNNVTNSMQSHSMQGNGQGLGSVSSRNLMAPSTHSMVSQSLNNQPLPEQLSRRPEPHASSAYRAHQSQSALSVMEDHPAPYLQPVSQLENQPEEHPVLWRSWREVVVFVKEQHAALLHAHLRHDVHLVRFSPPTIEIRVEDKAPSNIAQQLSKLLNEHSATRWTIVLSREMGEPTLMEQEGIQYETDYAKVKADPFVKEIMRIFPDATFGKLVNPELDEYGLFPENNSLLAQDDDMASFNEDEESFSLSPEMD